MDAFIESLESIKPRWTAVHGRRANFNWDAISQKMISTMSEIVEHKGVAQITSHDLLNLHERLNDMYRNANDNSIACSDACQVALDLAIKAQHAPSRKPGVELVA